MSDRLTEARGSSRPGMREVAEHAGVAMSSVSRVLSDHPDVSPKMRDAVMRAVHELGYRPDMLAQALRSGKTYSVGFTVSDIANHVLSEAVTGAEKRLREAGYLLLLTNSEGDPQLDAEHIQLFGRRRVDGLLLALAEEHHPATIAALRDVDVPIVLLDRDMPREIGARWAGFDHVRGMRDATNHLLSLGHRSFALITGGPERPARERRRAIEETLAEARNGAHCTIYAGEFSVEHGRQGMDHILSSDPRPTAIIASGNILMQGALLSLNEAGIEIGRDLSFVGCDDIVLSEIHRPPISVIRRDMHALGAAAADLLLADLEPDRRSSSEQPSEVMLPTEFIARASCAPVPEGR